MKRTLPILLIALIVSLTIPSAMPESASADETVTLRIAMRTARRGSVWRRTLDAWNNSLRSATSGAVQLDFSDGEGFAQKLSEGQLEGASMPIADLGEVVAEVRVLGAPGLITDYAQADRVIRRMGSDFEAEFASEGYKVLGWFDVGLTRLLSKEAIRSPEDLRGKTAWVPRRDQTFSQFLQGVGATPRRLPVGRVRGQLSNIDVLPTSALAAIFLNWYHEMSFVTEQARGVIMAATVIKQDAFDRLTPEQQAALLETSGRAHAHLRRQHRRQDAQGMRTLQGRNYTTVDLSPNQAAWDAASLRARNALAGRAYPRALMQRVERAAQN